MYDPALGRWHVLDALANDEMQIDKSPYSYAWNTPVNLTDPDGNCPWCIGAVIGAAVDYGAQVAMNYANGNESPWTDVDATSILISAASGAATGGLSAIGKTGAKTATQIAIKATAEVAIEATESVAQQMNDNVKSGNDVMDISVTKVATDVVMSKVADAIPAKSVDTKQLNNTLDRAQRVAGDTPRASRAAAVNNAQSKVNTANAVNTASKAVTQETSEKVLQGSANSVVSGSSGSGSSFVPPTYTQPADNTRVVTPYIF